MATMDIWRVPGWLRVVRVGKKRLNLPRLELMPRGAGLIPYSMI